MINKDTWHFLGQHMVMLLPGSDRCIAVGVVNGTNAVTASSAGKLQISLQKPLIRLHNRHGEEYMV